MHKQGGILLGTGGDNGNGSAGTFYEGVMTSGYPADQVTDAVQANIVAAKYDVQTLKLSRVTTFVPRSSQDLTVTFTNTTDVTASGVQVSLTLPAGWQARADGTSGSTKVFSESVPQDGSVSATFHLTSSEHTGAGYVMAKADWRAPVRGGARSETISTRVRNAFPVKINEARFGATGNATDQFIELYNASESAVDLSRWTVVATASQRSPQRLMTIPSGAILAPKQYYLLGLSGSGLAAPASRGDSILHVRDTSGFVSGQGIEVDGEAVRVVSVGTPAGEVTTLFTPVTSGPWLTIPSGSTTIPVTSTLGFVANEKLAIDIGGHLEIATATAVGKPATQTVLAAAIARGDTSLQVAQASNVSPGDSLTIGAGQSQEKANVEAVTPDDQAGGAVKLSSPLHFDHARGVDVSDPGTGITFSPATRYPHRSGDAIQALGRGITLDHPLARDHEIGTAVVNPEVETAGYQGSSKPNQWFGIPLSATAGSIALMDPTGVVVVDAVVYGSQQSNSSANGTITSPELATLEGDQTNGGCIVVAPAAVNGGGTSVGRFPDGADTDSNCEDFHTQAAADLAARSSAGADNIKVSSVSGFRAGQSITVDVGLAHEDATIAGVGSPGGTETSEATRPGAIVVPVKSVVGFSIGETVTIGDGATSETAVIATVSRRGSLSVSVSAPFVHAHDHGEQISGSGITLNHALNSAHSSGVPVAANVPTPGGSNQY